MNDNALVLKAAGFAADKHRNQRRKNAEAHPYINHPIAVSLLLAETGKIEDPEILAAALLHDTLEDTTTTPRTLKRLFGARISNIVVELTNDQKKTKAERKRLEIERAKTLSPEATLIRLCDKISNVSDTSRNPPAKWSPNRKKKYLTWAKKVVDNLPMVNAALVGKFEKERKAGWKKLIGLTV